MNLTCAACGTEFSSDKAMCKSCGQPMACTEDACTCESCGKEQAANDMWCPACLEKNAA